MFLRTILICLWAFMPETKAQTIQDSFISLQDQVRNCPPLKYSMPPDVAGTGKIEITIQPFQVISVNELHQTVHLTAVIAVFWEYPQCAWNISDFNGIMKIGLPSSDIWTPLITMPKSSAGDPLPIPRSLEILSYGRVQIYESTVFETTCYLDFLRYPFDEHNCTISFIDTSGLSIYPALSSEIPDDVTRYVSASAEWILLDSGCDPIGGTLNYTICWFTMQRRSIFYIAIILVPIILMSLMTLVVFCIPAECGEKMSFVIAIFVSMTVFINFFVDVIPRSTDQLPRIVTLIVTVMVKIGFAAFATALVLQRYYNEQKRGNNPHNDSSENQERMQGENSQKNKTDQGLDLRLESFQSEENLNKSKGMETKLPHAPESANLAETGKAGRGKEVDENGESLNFNKKILKEMFVSPQRGQNKWTNRKNKVGDLHGMNSYRKMGSRDRLVKSRSRIMKCVSGFSHVHLDRIFFVVFMVGTFLLYSTLWPY